jgi:hypothetical protein
MKRRTPSFARALLLLIVAVGPLQAQTAFACAMMDRLMQDECCCEHHEAARDRATSDRGAVTDSGESPCCEHSVEITADPDARHDGSISKPVELRSDVDPSQVPIPSFEPGFTPQTILGTRGFYSAPAAGHGGSDTWLVTQRLRI